MSKRNRREHGRILSVETMQRGSALDVDAAAGATSITVVDGGDFDEDGGWLYIGAQVIEFTACDDDTGVITLADPLTAPAEQGDPVAVYDPLYAEVVDYQVALVQLDGEYDNPDPVEAEVAEGVEDLPEGDRGKAGESCTLHRVADDEWEVVGVGGRSRKSRGLRFEQDDTYTLTGADVTATSATMPLSHRPANEALTCVLAGVPQPPTEWTIDYDAQTLTIPLSGWERAGDVAWVHYAYRKGVTTAAATPDLDGLPLVGWFSADYEIANQPAGAITTWSNLAPGREALDFTGTATLEATAGPNGGPCIHFTGTQKMTGVPAIIASGAAPPAEGFFVRSRDSAAVGSNHNFGSHSSADLYYPNASGQVLDDFWSSQLLTFTPTMSLAAWRRYNARSASGARSVYLDEVLQASSTSASTPGGPAVVFELGYNGGGAHNGRYGCILLFDAVLTNEQRAQVVDYLQRFPSGGLPS